MYVYEYIYIILGYINCLSNPLNIHHKYCLHNLLEDQSISDCFNVLAAIGTYTAAIFAYIAYKESLKSRKENTFNAMFTTLIAKQLEMFNGVPKNNKLFIQKTNPFKDFVYYFDSRLKMKPYCCIADITRIWNDYYTKKLSAPTHFSRCFKYVYNEINTIRKENMDKDKNRYYCELIQASMTKDELFCYLINLLVFFNRSPDALKNNEYNELQTFIKDNLFFEDLCRGRDRYEYPELLDSLLNNKPPKIYFIGELNCKDYTHNHGLYHHCLVKAIERMIDKDWIEK